MTPQETAVVEQLKTAARALSTARDLMRKDPAARLWVFESVSEVWGRTLDLATFVESHDERGTCDED